MVLLACALLLLSAAVLVGGQVLEHRRRDRRVAERLQGRTASDHKLGSFMRQLGGSALAQRSVSLDNETQVLLNRVGWRKASQRSLFAAFQVGTPIVLLGLTLLGQQLLFAHAAPAWIAPMFAVGIGYLLPKRVLAAAAKYRQQTIAKEISTFIPLLRILFESGMAIEQSLRVVGNEAQRLLPALTHELRLILARVDSGLELGEELGKTARLLEVDEFTDTCIILQQLIQQGGGAMKSLLALKQLLDDRRLTRLQEYISKMSAKMSVVMMVFLFPALLIVLGGPAFIGIARALSHF
ncbi:MULTISPECIES: type II secretion system F family protein [unclassified Pseudomonas]|uniref:type II secretion system F family protein n=1 Tax=unclassified Pseudomonas TaxID=196821 RepID=UPI0008E96A78|nr:MULTISPECIES: type II secretion system F family protein [unclassified Pseudomonas]PMV18889.1 type II secretion system F family protein [Pseudomonas sp. FW305-3-2-15-C-TSA2]PMV21870.1 type II secretion system F family protein [Pseudomonas sp. DP16D-L5]PMV42599.1 type II secretion system F family protein [Pseudomonas sp. FW305-3-2-15-A-LB2]PMV44242.1 type II secretion system F family protein [Pseudomonas sp. FW305-3-2-15-C-LB1]PMV49363.1 type II secretion system F family protein [Pseudomonas 